jgi:hypothetical protein
MCPDPGSSQDMSEATIGRSFLCLTGCADFSSFDSDFLSYPPESFDKLLRIFSYVSPPSAVPLRTSWTDRAFGVSREFDSSLATKRKYKPVDRKVRPVPSYMPDAASQMYKPIIIPVPTPLPFDPPIRSQFVPGVRLSRERLDALISKIPEKFLLDREIDLLIHVLKRRETAIAWTDSERGTFSRKYFPDYEIPVIEHTPWSLPPIRIPKAIEGEVRAILERQRAAGNYEN